MFDFNLMHIIAGLPGLLIAMVIHEYAHAQVAVWLGDFTPRLMGRLTLNPIPHIDPLGLGCFVLTSLCTPFVFGWAKPVPVNPRHFRNVRRDMLLVSAAGPLCNFLLALLMGLCLRLLLATASDSFILNTSAGNFVLQMLLSGISANLVLAWFNLIPIPPLDGGHILECLLPPHLAQRLAGMGRLGFVILAALLAVGALNKVLLPLLQFSYNSVLKIAGVL